MPYWFSTCPTCFGQGRLFIVDDAALQSLYLHCEECETGYANPEALKVENGFSTLSEQRERRLADLQTIRDLGWERFAVNRVEATDAPTI